MVECSVCFNQLCDGAEWQALVECGHMFCGTCLTRHWQSSRRREQQHHGREVAPCPVCRNPYNYRDGVTRLYPTYRTEAHATQAPFGGDGDTPPAGRRKRRRRASGEGAEDEDVVAVTPDRAAIAAAVQDAVVREKESLMGRIQDLEATIDALRAEAETLTGQAEERQAAQQREHARYAKLTARELNVERSRRAEAESEVLRLKGLLQEEQKKLALHSMVTSGAGGGGATAAEAEVNRMAKELLRTSKEGAESVIDRLCKSFALTARSQESRVQQLEKESKAASSEAMKANQRLEALHAQLREAQRQLADLREAGGDGKGSVLPVRHVLDRPTAAPLLPGASQRPTLDIVRAPSAPLQLRPAPSALNIVPHRTGATAGGLGGIDGGGSFLNAAGHVHGSTARGAAAGVINDGGRFIVMGADGRGGQARVLVPLVENTAAAAGAPGGAAKGAAKRSKGGRGPPAQLEGGGSLIQKWVAAATNRVVSTPPEPGWSA